MDYRLKAEQLLDDEAIKSELKAIRMLDKQVSGIPFILTYLSLQQNEQASPKALSESLMVSSPRVTALLNEMEREGLVLRTPDEEDNRQVIITLTDKGRKAAEEQHEKKIREITAMLEYLGPEDAEALVRTRRKLLGFSSKL